MAVLAFYFDVTPHWRAENPQEQRDSRVDLKILLVFARRKPNTAPLVGRLNMAAFSLSNHPLKVDATVPRSRNDSLVGKLADVFFCLI